MMEKIKWGKPFQINSLYDGWDEAPKKAGIYVIFVGKTIQRVGGADKKGILYIGKSLALRNRLYEFWETQHPASALLWTYPKIASLILKKRVKGTKDVERLVGEFNVAVAYPIQREHVDKAERTVIHAYFLRYGELPPLNFSFPMKWNKPPDYKLILWAGKILS